MITAPQPEDEHARVEALKELRLEPGRDIVLEEITALASEICETPISYVSIVEENSQWFKSGIGWEETETPRDVSFCSHTILEPENTLIVTDATADERFSDNPLVKGAPGIRFYAGAPLVTEAGHAVGSLCVVDHVPRELNDSQRRILERLASIAATHLGSYRERRALEKLTEVESQSVRVIDASLDAIVSTDADGTIVAWNPAAERTFGFTVERAIGARIGDLIIPPSFREAHEHGVGRYLATGESKILGRRLELSAMRADGHEFPVELTVIEVSKTPLVFTAHLRDITERREFERLLSQQNARLVELNRMREELVATVSHELRTPVASISSITELLQGDTDLPARSRELLAVVHRSARRLGRLVNDLLLIAEDEVAGLDLRTEVVDACLIVDDVCALVMPEAARRGLEIRTQCTVREPVEADPDRLAQVLSNLLSNAMNFTSEGGLIEVRASPAQAGTWRIEVRDSGVGVPAEEIEHLFDPFYRASTASESWSRGSGLGLPIVKAIVMAHGGSVGVDSVVGEGTVFRIELPRSGSELSGVAR